MFGNSQFGHTQLGRTSGVFFDTTGPNCLSTLSQTPLWMARILRPSEDVAAVQGVAGLSRQLSAPDILLMTNVSSRGTNIRIASPMALILSALSQGDHSWWFMGPNLIDSLIEISLPYWTETAHIGIDLVGSISDAAYRFTYLGWVIQNTEDAVNVLSKTLLKRAWVPTAKSLICNIYDASIWTRDLIAPYRFLVTSVEDQPRIWRTIAPPVLINVLDIQEQMRAWRTIVPLSLINTLGVMSNGLLSAWNPIHSILEANTLSTLESGEGIRFVLGNDVTGIVLAIGSFSPHYATVGENLVDIYQVGLLSMVRNAPQRSLLLYIMDSGMFQSLQWLKQVDTGEAWENQEDVLASWIHQEDVAVTVPSRFHRQGTTASTFKAQEDGTSIFKN